MRKFRLLLSLLVAALLVAACGTGGAQDPTDRNEGEGVTLRITPAALTNANVDEEYTFVMEARGLPEGMRFATFGWSFDGGADELRAVSVKNGVATVSMKRSFAAVGEYELNAKVGQATGRNLEDYDQLATASLRITVGDGQPGASANLTISPGSVANGEIGREYTFTFEATDIPAGIDIAMFSWGLAGSEWERQDVGVAGGAATSEASFTFDAAGTYRLNVLLTEPHSGGDPEDVEILASGTVSIVIGTETVDPADNVVLTIDPASVTDGKVGQAYSFTLEATEIPDGLTEVILAWQFEGQARAYQRVSVVGGVASHTVSRTYGQSGTYWLRGWVGRPTHATDDSRYDELDSAIATISVETDAPDRDVELGSCDGWVETQSGGHGVTVDHWDLSGVPVGAVIDIRYDTISIPDNFIIEYPVGRIVYETGWVGSSVYNWPFFGGNRYPGGVVGEAKGAAEGIFTRQAGHDEFKVTVLGPDQNTLWSYEIRCHVPE